MILRPQTDGCPFYDFGDGGWGDHCNITPRDKSDICIEDNCPLGPKWYKATTYTVNQLDNKVIVNAT
jgi:hypothetical protein